MKKLSLLFAVMCLVLCLAGCSCKHKNTEVRGAFDPTCTSTGYSGDTFCLDCSTTILAGGEIPKGAHALSAEPVGAFDPTCDLPGFAGNTYCTECEDLVIKGSIIAPYGHITGELKYVSEPDCNDEGFTGSAFCEKCSFAVIAGKEIPPLGHVFETKVNYIAPTCTSKGSYDATCARCGYTSEDIEESKLPHTFENGFCTICGWQEIPGLYEGETLKYTWDQLIEQELIKINEHKMTIKTIDPSLIGRLVIAEDYNYEFDAMYGCPFTEIWFPYNVDYIYNLEGSANLERIRFFSPNASTGSFTDCTSLKEIDVPRDSMDRIDKDEFKNCTSLEKVNILAYYETIQPYGFADCASLKEISFPESEKEYSRFYIQEYAFENCTSLEKLVLPSSLSDIEKNAFVGCDNLTLYLRMSEQTANERKLINNIPDSIRIVYDYTGE